ncbi:PLAT/LH2 domain-containing protein [Streptomyces regalis]|uniref:PLAT domain-containing protein n=1 Tax=Streptomyces regalis TaxID=68262 RepID=A0A0X3VEC5_9ACTN|nr:PLAT/LH2 domain-containing protein [Streptomyces regalis]KUL42767.1 hypothetical protein ADL12_08955 [Streptomyces regalis]
MIADESIAKNFGEIGDGSFSGMATSVVNKTKRTLELFEHPDLKGECLKVPPGGPYELRDIKNERGASLNDHVYSARLGDLPFQGLINRFRNTGYQAFGGKVDKESGKAEGASGGVIGAVANLGYVATGGKMAGKDQQSELIAAQERAAAAAVKPLRYVVRVITRKLDRSGTDDDVFCQFARGDRKSGWVKLDTPRYNDFEKGDDDEYEVTTPGHFGDPQRVEFKISGDDKWLLQWVNMRNWGNKDSTRHCPLLNVTKVWLSTAHFELGEGAGGIHPGAEISLFLALGADAVQNEPNPDAEKWARAMTKGMVRRR